MASPQRVNKIKVQLQRELGDIIQNMSDPRLERLTVSDVTLTRDLSVATLYISVLGDNCEKETALTAMRRALGHIRSQIAKRIQLRYAPEFRVQYDPTGERAARVLSLIDSIKNDNIDG